MNNQKPPKKDVSIFQEKTSRFKQKPSSIFKKIPRMEIKPSNNWRILKIGPSSKRIKKRKKMSDFATSRKYLDNLRRIEFDTNYHPVAIPFKPMEDKGNSNEPIIIEDEEDEESSDCESEHKKRLIDALYSLMQRVEQISLKSQRKPRESTLKDEQMQENKAEKENPREQNLPKDLEVVPSPQRPVSIESSTLNTNVLYEKPQIPQTNTENTLKEHFDQSDPIQNIPNPLAFENKFNALRTLLNLQTEGYPPELLYWAQIGMGMWARENMTQVIPSAINHPILYPPYQVPFSDQDMQALQITPDVNIVEQNQSVIENTLDSVQLESVQNPTELNLLPENINELDSAPRTIDIPTETPTVTNDIEQNTEIRMDKPTTSQNSEGALNVSANPENFTEFIRELDDLLEQLKSSTKAINNQLNNRSLFNTSEIMDEVMNGVHGYCTQRDTNVSASRSQGATAANQRVKKREHRNTSVDSNNDICYDDDVMDEDYRTDTDEEDDSDRKPKRKRIRISFDLPPEYDPDDSRWCLKYRGEGLGVKEIMPNSNVYVNERQVMNCKRVAKTSNALATMLLVEIFSYNALIVCSLTGSKATSYQVEGDKVRPGLDKNARETLLAYVEQHEEEMKWPKERFIYLASLNAALVDSSQSENRLIQLHRPVDLRRRQHGLRAGRGDTREGLVESLDQRVFAHRWADSRSGRRKVGEAYTLKLTIPQFVMVQSELPQPEQLVFISQTMISCQLDHSQHRVGISAAQERPAAANVGAEEFVVVDQSYHHRGAPGEVLVKEDQRRSQNIADYPDP
ncbi:hypothetical protein MSG28_014068 [Choristoneura fumiferana]|uniref:Uncharacterized protein n=1 Tax=Choristoneura fumiferana TaxID=7141 RepID=A0ACC0JFR1_CHOFU|nr:hypothetical protein MSG28_014068 [Choristoneura fumiferana]